MLYMEEIPPKKESDDLFSYRNLNQLLLSKNQKMVMGKNYSAVQGDGKFIGPKGFIFVGKNSGAQIDEKSTEEGYLWVMQGLKFHVSLPENDPEKYARGWDITKDVLMRNGIKSFKVAHENIKMSAHPPDGSQRGKDITIYVEKNHEKDFDFWNRLHQEITDELVKAGIPPGYRPPELGRRDDKPINGSNYITYRYEKIDFPEIKDDLCQKMQVNNPNQKPPMEWKNSQVIANKLQVVDTIVNCNAFWEPKAHWKSGVPAGIENMQGIVKENIDDNEKWTKIKEAARTHIRSGSRQDPVTEKFYQSIIDEKPEIFFNEYKSEIRNVPKNKFI